MSKPYALTCAVAGKLEFEFKPSFGRKRFYPLNDKARLLVEHFAGKRCLDEDDLERLDKAGFGIKVLRDQVLITETEEV